MSDNILTDPEKLPVEEMLERRADPKVLRWFELGLVLSIAFLRPLIGSVAVLWHGRSAIPAQPGMTWTFGIVHELTGILLLAYVLYRRKLSFRDLGLRWSFRDLPRGIVLTVAAYVIYIVAGYILWLVDRHFFPGASSGVLPRDLYGHMSFLTVPFLLINPFFEELIVRAYLMSEIRELTGSWLLAVVASTMLQASYHLYYGWTTALALGFQFLVLSIYYARTRRITPVIFVHEVFDLIALLHPW